MALGESGVDGAVVFCWLDCIVAVDQGAGCREGRGERAATVAVTYSRGIGAVRICGTPDYGGTAGNAPFAGNVGRRRGGGYGFDG